MPPPIQGPTSKDKIMEAAGKLFARQGYHGTSTRQIAQFAGVGENTLFRQFNHKEVLFWSTLRFYSSGLMLRRDLQEGLTQRDSPTIVLPKILDMLTELVIYKPDLLRMIAVAFIELHWNAKEYCNDYLSPFVTQIRQYLEGTIKEGKFRDMDATMLTTALTMSTLMYPGIATLVSVKDPLLRSDPERGRAHSEFWMDLLAPGLLGHGTQVVQRID